MMFRHTFIAPPEPQGREYALGKVADTLAACFVTDGAISASYEDETLLRKEFLCSKGNAMYTLTLSCERYRMVTDLAMPPRIMRLEVIASGDEGAVASIEGACRAVQERLTAIGKLLR